MLGLVVQNPQNLFNFNEVFSELINCLWPLLISFFILLILLL